MNRKKTYIKYRDKIGYIAAEIDMEYGVSFHEGIAYFTDTDGRDHAVRMEQIDLIINETEED